MIRGLALSLAFTLGGALGSGGRAQELTPERELSEIEHTPAPCMDTEEFPLIEARTSSAAVARSLTGLTIRFKAENDNGWYETSFRSSSGTTFQAALPKPLTDAGRVTYYFTSAGRRTPDYPVPVLMGGCPGARTAPSDLAGDIRVRRTSDGQSQIPAGFSPDGISAGRSMSGTTLGIVAAAAGGAGVAALVISGEEVPPTDGGPSNPAAIRACFAPDPIPEIDSGDSLLFDASCTTPASVTNYQWNFGDGTTTATGSSVEHLFSPGGIYSVTLTASEGARSDTTSRLVTVIATPSACFITNPNPPRIAANESINFNAECSEGDRDGGAAAIARYEWDFGDGRPGAEGVFISRQFPQPDVYGVRLTVTNADGIQATNTQFVVVESEATANNRDPALGATDLNFTSTLELPEANDGVHARVSVNDSIVVATTAATRHQHRIRARTGENVIEGRLISEASGPGQWRFDFNGSTIFVAGSLQVDSGEVLASDGHSIVFRVTGKPGPFVRFRFRVEE